MSTALNNHLAAMAEDVKSQIARSEQAFEQHVAHAIDAGAMLISAKEECAHGEWLPFLDRAGVHKRQAQRLMKLARSGMKSDTVSFLGGMKAALRHLDKPDLPGMDEALEVRAQPEGWVFIIPSRLHPGYWFVGGVVGGEEMCNVYTRRPMWSNCEAMPGVDWVWWTAMRFLDNPASYTVTAAEWKSRPRRLGPYFLEIVEQDAQRASGSYAGQSN